MTTARGSTPEATPRFAILIAAHNAAATLAETLDSVLAQSCPDWEAVVVDDGSTDDTAAVATAYADRDARIRVLAKSNGGAASARNLAARSTAAPLLCVLDADDLYTVDYLDHMGRFIDQHEDFEIYSCEGFRERPSGELRLSAPLAPGEPLRSYTADDLIEHNRIWVQSVVRRATFDDAGGFDEDPRLMHEDYEFWLRALLRGARHIRNPERLCVYRMNPRGKSADTRAVADGYGYVLDKLIAGGALHGERLVAARRRRARLEWAPQDLIARRARDTLEERLLTGDIGDARRLYVAARRAYPSRSRYLAGLAFVLVSPRLFARVLARRGTSTTWAHAAVDHDALRLTLERPGEVPASATEIDAPADGAEGVRVSAVVCTYDRSAMLERAVLSLVVQTVDHRLFEVIVVDNGSHDATQEVVRRIRADHPETRIRLISELRQGLSQARNTGAAAAAGEYVAYLDDDAAADPDWLAEVLRCLDTVTPRPTVVGGPIAPLYDAPRPRWYRDEYELRTWGPEARVLGPGETFSGSNITIETEALRRHAGFATHLGMVGDRVSVAEETELLERMRATPGQKPTFFYCPSCVVRHSVTAAKMRVGYQLRRFVMGGYVAAQESPPEAAGVARAVVAAAVRILWIGFLYANRRRDYASVENWAVEALRPAAVSLGRAAGCLGLPLRMKR